MATAATVGGRTAATGTTGVTDADNPTPAERRALTGA
jgi:hypothetical protein